MSCKFKAFWLNDIGDLAVIDQRFLPFKEDVFIIKDTKDTIFAIKDMVVRGAGVIGNVAAFGIYLAAREVNGDYQKLKLKASQIRVSRPTAVNLMWAVDRVMKKIENSKNIIDDALSEAILIAQEDEQTSRKIGHFGCEIFENIIKQKNRSKINVLTHCNAGWLAIVDDGTALAPIYEAKRRGIDIHVWVDETRPRNQGANLTAWELSKAGIDHTIIADNTGGYLMQQGFVDCVIVGADRVSLGGDVANKIGTYLKALSAKDNNVPFYVALPASTFDFSIIDGVKEIPIEVRSDDEVKYIRGLDKDGLIKELLITPKLSKGLNYGFDITPSRLIDGLITQRGVTKAEINSIKQDFKDLI